MKQQPLRYATDTELADSVHENLYELFRAMSRLPGGTLVEREKICYHHSFPHNPKFRGVWRARLAPGEVEEAVEEAVAWFEQLGARDFFWWLDKRSRPNDLINRLLGSGFDGNLVGEPGMAADLYNMKEDSPTLPDFHIVQAVNQDQLNDWRDVLHESFDFQMVDAQSWVDATNAFPAEDLPWSFYVGYLDGKPVGSCALVCGAGVAGLYAIGTVPEARGKGIGTAMTLKPLLDARQQGYVYGVLFASRPGYPIYKQIGFQDVNNPIGIFYRGIQD